MIWWWVIWVHIYRNDILETGAKISTIKHELCDSSVLKMLGSRYLKSVKMYNLSCWRLFHTNEGTCNKTSTVNTSNNCP